MNARHLYLRLRSLWTWRRREAELDEEIRFHLSEEAEERAAEGLSPDEARAAARRDFGNPTVIREVTRETWGWAGAERVIQDARYTLRMMRRNPGFAAVAVLTLALGIGATTAILNVVNALLLRSLPFPDAEQLVMLYATTPRLGVYRDTTSFLDFTAWKSQTRAFTDAAAYRRDPFTITGDGAPEPIEGLRASNELLNVLGMTPAIGRAFDEREQRGNHAVALISYGLWVRRYGSDPRILGRTVLLDEVSHSVVGVLPPGFQFPAFQATDVLVPIPERTCRSCGYLRAVARLKPGVRTSTAQHELDAVAAGLEKAFPDSNEGRGVNVVRLHEAAVGPVYMPLMLLLAAGGFVLLIGCANVGNLVLARGIARQREMAVRSALGAGAARLVRQLVTESVSFAVTAALLGSILAIAASDLLVASLSERFPLPPIPFNWTLLGFAVLVALVSGVLSGLPAALMVWKADLNESLKQDGRSQSDGRTQQRLRNLLIVSQTALTVMLLVGAGLLARSFLLIQQVEIGLNPRHVLTADLLLSKRYADHARRAAFVGDLLSSIRSLPGVQHAGVQTYSPFSGGGSRETFTIEGQPDPGPRNGHPAGSNLVDGDFFAALNIAVVRGRVFDGRETLNSAPVAVVNETMARRFWPNEDATGKRIRLYYDKDPGRWISVIGVVRDARYRYEEASTPKLFLPYSQNPYRALPYAKDPMVSLVLRTATDPGALIPAVQASVWRLDKDQPVLHLQPMEQILWRSVAEPRIYALLVGIFAVLALVIASGGIYGMSAYAVVRRTREIGIRMAVGASSGQIIALVLRQGMVLTLMGVGIGAVASIALRRVISGFLFGVTATDGLTFLAVLLLFGTVAFLSTLVPARRAARIDPTLAFRSE